MGNYAVASPILELAERSAERRFWSFHQVSPPSDVYDR